MTHERSADVLSWIGTLARLIVGSVFLVAGALKVGDPQASVRAVHAYRLLPTAVGEVVGYTLPAIEIGIGLLLLVGLMTRAAAIAALVLLAVFVIGVSSAWTRGLSIDCGCFGGGGEVAPGATRYVEELTRDVTLIVAAAFLIVRPRTRLSLDRRDDRGSSSRPSVEEIAA
jgi:uncharacterized membrane protein YphA (DoxX/SURF4 family)